jgi:16S rRNA (guanine(527)-N(7))-methyltransferase RsmG
MLRIGNLIRPGLAVSGRKCVPYTGPMAQDPVSDLARLVQLWDFPVAAETAERLGLYMTKLLEWNRHVNLTGARGLEEIVGEHLPDSFALARLCPDGASVVDVGAGGGLPALPFAMLRPDCQVTLVEPRAKRVAFLNMAVRVCDCRRVSVVRGRAEELGGSRFSVATSRATFSPEAWLRIAPGVLQENGIAVVFATSPVGAVDLGSALRQAIDYRTMGGSPRWVGLFCFT